jgi:hypothetical protein
MAKAKKKKIEEVSISPVTEETVDESVIKAAEILVAASDSEVVQVEKQEAEIFTAYEFQAVRSESHMLKIGFRNSIHKLVKEMGLVDGFKVVVNQSDLANVPSMFSVETNEEIPMGKFLIVK